jgi:acetyltransferase-like isoleucine patch superfamily enzyme
VRALRYCDLVGGPVDQGPRARPWRRSNLPSFAAFGAGSRLAGAWTVTEPGRITIGRDVVLGPRVWLALATDRSVQVTQGDGVPAQRFDPRLAIGDRTCFGADLTIACLGRVDVGADVLGGDRILIGDTYHDYRDPSAPIAAQPMAAPRPVSIGDGVVLGTGVVVNPGVRIGAGAVVQPGAVVTRDVAPRAVVGGAPARVLGGWGPPAAPAPPGG